MQVTVPDSATRRASSTARSRSVKTLWLLISIAALVAAIAASLAIGSRTIELPTVVDALIEPDGTDLHLVVTELRLPRTVLAVLVGAAFAVAGALIQAVTRNPLADPGILGVNAGAAFAVVLGVIALGVTRIEQYLPLAFIGAVLATVLVYAVAMRGGGGATPVRLTLVGVALGAVLSGISSTLALIDADAFDRMRFWGAGSIADRPPGTIEAVAPFIVIGLVLAIACAKPLNALALGDDSARSLGVNVTFVRVLCIVAVTLLCGAGTAAAGPIGFIGLMVPHIVRWLVGPDQRWIIPFSVVLGPLLLLVSDLVGRVIVWPAELQVGIVTAFVGAPLLMVLVRRKRAIGL